MHQRSWFLDICIDLELSPQDLRERGFPEHLDKLKEACVVWVKFIGSEHDIKNLIWVEVKVTNQGLYILNNYLDVTRLNMLILKQFINQLGIPFILLSVKIKLLLLIVKVRVNPCFLLPELLFTDDTAFE